MNINRTFQIASEIYKKITDGTHDSPKQKEEGKPLITSKHIKGRNIDFESAYLISFEDFTKINQRSQVEQWDVIVSMIGEYCGYCYVERSEIIDYAVKNVGIYKTGSKLEAEWLYYYLNSTIGQYYLNSVKSGSSQPYLTLGALRNLPILQITREIEKKQIVKVLSDLDAKIELNNRINRELEAMAKTLYDYWFVQFDFPVDNNFSPSGEMSVGQRGYKSSGGKMVYNAELKREIPEGWEVKKLGELIIKYTDKSIHIESKNILNKGKYPVITQDNGDFISGFTNEENPIEDVPLIIFGDHSCTLRYIDFSFFRGADGTQIMSFGKDLTIYVYIYLQSIIKQIPGYGKYERHYKYLKEFDVIVPESQYLKNFQLISKPIFDKISQSRLENQQLAELRDWLLPMLMNGQVVSTGSTTVKEAEESLSSSAERSRSMAAEPSVEYKTKGNG